MTSRTPLPVLWALVLWALAVTFAAPIALPAQVRGIPDSLRADPPPVQRLSGPRFGFTAFTGDVADLREAAGRSAFMSQFGWQFETQLVSTETGHQALIEVIPLVGGVEENDFNVSVAWMAGLRTPVGLEFGVGPNVSRSSATGDLNSSLVTALGITMPFGDIRIPANLAMAFSDGGPRMTVLVGWIVGSS